MTYAGCCAFLSYMVKAGNKQWVPNFSIGFGWECYLLHVGVQYESTQEEDESDQANEALA